MLARLKPLASSLTINLILPLGLIFIFGVWLLLISTPEGLGLNDDSVAYINGARGIVSGDGYRELWIISKGPILHFPPGFPGVLAFLGFITQIDPLRISRILNAFYFGGNAFLLGFLCWRATKSQLASIFTSIIFVATPGFLQVHSMAMSEPQYIFLTLVIILLFDLYFERDQIKYIVLAGILAGLAYLTRYAALALIMTGIIVLFVHHGTWRKRIIRSIIFILSTLPLILGWSIRNSVVGGSVTNRQASWHPIVQSNINTGLREFSAFLMPTNMLSLSRDTIFIFASVIVSILFAWVLFVGIRYFLKPKSALRPPLIPFTHALYILGYFSSLIVTMTFFDPATKFQLRIVAPIFVSLLFLVVIACCYFAKRSSVTGALMVTLVGILFLFNFSVAQKQNVEYLGRGGQLYASYKWYDSKILALVRNLPAETVIYTNQLEAVYFYTQRVCYLMPGEDKAQKIRQNVIDDNAVMVLFFSNGMDAEEEKYYKRLGDGLKIIREGPFVMYVKP